MPHNPIGVFDAGNPATISMLQKAACRKQAALQRAKLANASPDAATMLAGITRRV